MAATNTWDIVKTVSLKHWLYPIFDIEPTRITKQYNMGDFIILKCLENKEMIVFTIYTYLTGDRGNWKTYHQHMDSATPSYYENYSLQWLLPNCKYAIVTNSQTLHF